MNIWPKTGEKKMGRQWKKLNRKKTKDICRSKHKASVKTGVRETSKDFNMCLYFFQICSLAKEKGLRCNI